jgi:hypothetical protein
VDTTIIEQFARVLAGPEAVITADPFSLENLVEPHGLHEQLREKL